MRNTKLAILKLFATLFLLVGLVGWFAPLKSRSYTEIPNSEPHGIDVDNDGNIYCGSAFYGRIQKYTSDGRFIRGFDTHGGTGWGSDFGFYLDEDGHLCIRVSGLAPASKGSFHRTTVYDSEGNIVETEEYTSPDRDYAYPVKNTVLDAIGNVYTLKGFLFPRVVKHTKDGHDSVIIRTPVWLWFFQAPFPAFAFFFGSTFMVIFLSGDAALLKAAVKYFSVRGRLRTTVISGVFLIGVVAFLVFLMLLGLKKSPMVAILGFISLAIAVALAGLILVVYSLRWTWYFHKHYPDLSKKRARSMKDRLEFGRVVRASTASDPVLFKMKSNMKKVVGLCFLAWLTLFLLVSIIASIIDSVV